MHVRETDRMGKVERIAQELSRDSQVNVQFQTAWAEGQLRRTAEKRKSVFRAFLCRLATGALLCPFGRPGSYMHKCVHTQSQPIGRLRANGNCGSPIQRAAEIRVTLRGMITAFVAVAAHDEKRIFES